MNERLLKLAETLVQMLRESTLIQGTLTLMVTVVWLVMMASGKPVPDVMNGIEGIIVGYYFGTKSQLGARTIVQDFVKVQEKRDTEILNKDC